MENKIDYSLISFELIKKINELYYIDKVINNDDYNNILELIIDNEIFENVINYIHYLNDCFDNKLEFDDYYSLLLIKNVNLINYLDINIYELCLIKIFILIIDIENLKSQYKNLLLYSDKFQKIKYNLLMSLNSALITPNLMRYINQNSLKLNFKRKNINYRGIRI